ncbi:MAG TPA: LacI family DNA-binding transcriptional regulator [Bryobacteraceae bacterium]|nr:LacI family DNA-binding transcriptional regulator [Bryobacteraceae bacterium]
MRQSRPHPTLADVAQRAGVGKTTVSRVINGAHKVGPETLERINKVIRELGYHPSQAARSLKGESTKTVGLILPRIADPFFASCAEAVQAVARSHEYLLMVAVTGYDSQTEINQLYTLLRHRVDGILLAPSDSGSKKLAEIVGSINIPVVTFNHPLAKGRAPSVVVDNYGGARAATRHLIEHGRKRILCLGGDARLYSVHERQRGYRDAMFEAGLQPMIDDSANEYEEIEKIVGKEWLRKKPVQAIFGVRNLVTIYAFQALQSMGLKIGEEVALAGFDDFELACTLRPAVTVVRQPVEELASRAANLLFERLQDGAVDRLAGKPEKLKTRLIVRSSCGC